MLDQTLPERFAQHGVNVNGLIIPGRLIGSTLARHSFNLIVANDDEIFKISLIGSATAIRYKGREILLCTQHQLQGQDESRVAMLTDSGSHVITSGGRRGYNLHPDTDAHDVVAFDFTEPCRDYPELKKRFFNLMSVPPEIVPARVLSILLAGYPSGDQQYEVHENNHLGIVCRHVVCHPEGQPSDTALLTVKAGRPVDQHPDGMSGGSAFVIQSEDDELKGYFAGIIVRAGNGLFYILKAGVVCAFLESVFA